MANKKDFTNIGKMAATRFLSEKFDDANKDKEITANKENTKSKRINLLIYPDLFDMARKIAIMEQISFNEYLNRLIASDVEKQKDVIKKYDEVFKD